jgi:hypothetical protein
MALAARLPKLCNAASSPNADPRSSAEARAATAACSAVSTQPIAIPAATNQGRQGQDAGAAGGEAGVGQPEQGHAEGQDLDGAAAVAEAAGGDAGQGGGDVVGDIEAKGELGGPVLVTAGGQQFGGAQDQQGGGHVAELERRHPDQQPAKPSD